MPAAPTETACTRPAGSALTAAAWSGGWPAVCALGAALSATGLLLWLLERRSVAAPPRNGASGALARQGPLP